MVLTVADGDMHLPVKEGILCKTNGMFDSRRMYKV